MLARVWSRRKVLFSREVTDFRSESLFPYRIANPKEEQGKKTRPETGGERRKAIVSRHCMEGRGERACLLTLYAEAGFQRPSGALITL